MQTTCRAAVDWHMTFECMRPYGPLDEARLLAFERELPWPLPADYRQFLVEHNGATVSECETFTEVPGHTKVEDVFGFHDGPTYLQLDRFNANCSTLVPQSLILIASDPYGNYFGMALDPDRRGRVYFVDHEQLAAPIDALVEVASSFSALLERIGTDMLVRPPPRDVKEAILRRDVDALRAFLSEGSSAGAGFVHTAVSSGHPEILRLVLAHGGDPNERGAIGESETPLFAAARSNGAPAARMLLAAGADPNATCGAGGTAMEMASNSPEVLELLVRAGARPTTRLLHEAVRRILGEPNE